MVLLTVTVQRGQLNKTYRHLRICRYPQLAVICSPSTGNPIAPVDHIFVVFPKIQ